MPSRTDTVMGMLPCFHRLSMGLGVRQRFGLCAVPLLLGLQACAASAGSGSPDPTSTSAGAAGAPSQVAGAGAAGSSPAATDCQKDASLAPARIWRLTDAEYVSAVQRIFGVTMPPQVTSVDVNTGEYTNFAELSKVSPDIVDAYQSAARLAAQQAVTSHLTAFLPCGGTDTCVSNFLKNRVSRAYGRPLADDELQAFMDLYHNGSADGSNVGIRMVIEATLQSPSFLYRTELGARTVGGPTAKVTLTPHEIATSLSYALQDTVPDDTLWDKAEDGSLAKPEVLTAEVDRLLADPATKANLGHMAGYWLGIERLIGTQKHIADPNFALFTDAFKAELYQSAQLFVQEVLATGKATDLLTSKRMYLNEDLAKAYGVPGVTGSTLVPVDLSSNERSGIITQPAVLAAFSRADRGDPIHRGLFIYNSLACGSSIGSPPASATTVAAGFPMESTERQLSGFRADLPLCRTCHHLFDPLGLATEQYDPIGRYEPTDATGAPVDASSTINGLGADLDGPITGLADLIQRLVVGRRFPDCAATNLAVFMLGQTEAKDKSCALQAVKDQFAKTGSFKDYYRALVTSPAFVTRDPALPAAAPAP